MPSQMQTLGPGRKFWHDYPLQLGDNELVLRSHFHKGTPAIPGTYEFFFRGIGCRTLKSLFASFDVLLPDRPPAGLPDLALSSPLSTGGNGVLQQA